MSNDTFNLPSPPGFRGLHPDLPMRVYHRHLPHWRQAGATYFVTFRLGDALPQSKLQLLKRVRSEWERMHPKLRSDSDWEQYARQYTTHVERWLDEGFGDCHLKERSLAEIVRDCLVHFQDERYAVSSWAIMPNHCHLVIRPFDDSLEDLVGAMKGVSGREINQLLGRSGPVWQEESYDRIIRNEEHLWRVIQYIGRNPRLAGLQQEQEWRRWIDPAWEALGWRFVDE